MSSNSSTGASPVRAFEYATSASRSASAALRCCPREALTVFTHADAQARFGASVFWLREGMLDERAMRELFLVWQTKRDGSLRGLLEVA